MHFFTRGSGIPLLCLHGFPLDHQSLMFLEPAFARSGDWKRIYVDLPGMGQSASSPDINGYGDVLRSLQLLVDQEIRDEKYAIFGYSFLGGH